MSGKQKKRNPDYLSRVFQFGALAPTFNLDVVEKQMWLAHKYYNNLIEKERERRDLIRDNIKELKEKILEVKARYKPLEKGLKGEELRDLRKEKKEEIKQLKERYSTFRKEISEMVNIEVCNLRKSSGVYWGTKNIIERAWKAAKDEKATPLWRKGKPCNPHFRKWNGDAQIAVQLQNSEMDGMGIFNDDSTLVRIAPVDPVAWDKDARRCDQRRAARTELMIRVGSEEKSKKPVWAKFPIIMHRPLLMDKKLVDNKKARVTWVAVSRRHCGHNFRWSCEITINYPPKKPLEGDNGIAVDIGWRLLKNGEIRVGAWHASDKDSGEIRIPRKMIKKMEKCDELRSIRDTMMNNLREIIAAMRDRAPRWFKKRTRGLDKWLSNRKFRWLYEHWKDNRWDGDDVWFARMEKWYFRDEHLWDYEAGRRRRQLAFREDMYRKWAAEKAEKYDVLYLEDLDLSKFAEKEQLASDSKVVRHNRFLAGLYRLRGALVNAFTSRRKRLVWVEPQYTTKICSYCWTCHDFDAARNLRYTCNSIWCQGVNWDQDYNAARNIIVRGEVDGYDEAERLRRRELERGRKKREGEKPPEEEAADDQAAEG